MTREIIIRRLFLIKYLYKIGLEQSRLPEMIAFSSILTFHDTIDMFLQLAAQNKGVYKKGKTFLMEYFDLIPGIQHKASVNKINTRRNSIKHNGQIPAKIEVQESQTITNLFLEENTRIIFNLEFDDISLIDLVTYDNVGVSLKQAQNFMIKRDKKNAVIQIAIAFHQLLDTDKKVKINSKRFLVDHDYKTVFTLSLKRLAPIFATFSNREVEKQAESFDKYLKDTLDKYNENFKRLADSLKILSLGIDYRKYTQFRMVTPWVNFDGNNYRVHGVEEELLTDQTMEFLFDFVVETALKMQQFEIDESFSSVLRSAPAQ